MKKRMLRLFVFCMFAGLAAGLLSLAVYAQEATNQDPVLMVKIRNMDQFISDMERLVPQTPGLKAGQQIGMLRMMLQGTDWIDPERSIVAGMVLEGQKASWIAMIPYSSEGNATFQQQFSAIDGGDYYLLPLPPQPGASVSPAVEQSLISASREPAASKLVFEAAAGKLLDMLQPQMAALSKKIETAPAEQMEASGIAPEQIQSMLNSMVENFRQVDILRFGLDLSGDIFTLHFDIDALPGSMLAGKLTDQGGDVRLKSYQFDMPLRYQSRAHNMAGFMEMMKSSLGAIYSQLGLDVDDMTEIMKAFTGEMAGGIRIGAEGFDMEAVAVLQPGIDGEDFVENTYMPFFELYNKQISDFVAKETGKPGPSLYERTADSTVAGIKVMGVSTNFDAAIPPNLQKDNPFAGQTMEIRLAGAGDLLFVASNDVEMGELIAGSRGLVRIPAEGPTVRFDLDLGAFLKDIQSMLPPEKASTPLPVDLGTVTMQADMKDGKLATQTSFNIAEIQKLIGAIASAASKAKTTAGAAGPNPM